MRTFIAIPCPQDAKEDLAKTAEEIKTYCDIKAVSEENMHLTLRFLGEVDGKKQDEVIKALSQIKHPGGFDVCIKGLGAFPSPGSPHVIWAGVEQGRKELQELHDRIEESIVPLGFERDDRFSCHYTIARIKQPQRQRKA